MKSIKSITLQLTNKAPKHALFGGGNVTFFSFVWAFHLCQDRWRYWDCLTNKFGSHQSIWYVIFAITWNIFYLANNIPLKWVQFNWREIYRWIKTVESVAAFIKYHTQTFTNYTETKKLKIHQTQHHFRVIVHMVRFTTSIKKKQKLRQHDKPTQLLNNSLL